MQEGAIWLAECLRRRGSRHLDDQGCVGAISRLEVKGGHDYDLR